MTDPQREAARALFPEGWERILPLREGPDKALVFDLLWPVHAVQARSTEAARQTEAVLLITLPGVLLTDLLAPGKLLESVERLYLLQPSRVKANHNVWADVNTGTFKPTQGTADTDTLVRRGSLTDPAGDGSGEDVYALALPVAGTPWHLVYERSAADVNAPLLPLRLVAAALVLLLTGITAVLMLALWWRQSLQDGQAMTEQYRRWPAKCTHNDGCSPPSTTPWPNRSRSPMPVAGWLMSTRRLRRLRGIRWKPV